ncbi:hypothetical protein ACWIG5_41775, partial [Streptomyces lydicus]
SFAIANPIPVLPPVITAVLPWYMSVLLHIVIGPAAEFRLCGRSDPSRPQGYSLGVQGSARIHEGFRSAPRRAVSPYVAETATGKDE